MRLGIYAVALLACAMMASAHLPYESSTVVQFDGNRLELTVTTSAEIAGYLVGQPMSDAAALENLRPQLSKAGTELYEVTASGQPLQPERTFLRLRGGEAVFALIYPVGRPAELRVRAAYLDKLPLGYGAPVEVFDEVGNLVHREQRLKKGETKDSFTLQVPAAISAPVSSTPESTPVPSKAAEPLRTVAAPEPVVITPKHDGRLLPWIVAICAIFSLVVVVTWRFQRSRT